MMSIKCWQPAPADRKGKMASKSGLNRITITSPREITSAESTKQV
jgi:hypothetical protein